MESSISDEDIPKEVGKYSIIESHVNMSEDMMNESYYRIPIIFHANVSH